MFGETIKQQPADFLKIEKAYGDFASQFIRVATRNERPFFLYYPSHVSPEPQPSWTCMLCINTWQCHSVPHFSTHTTLSMQVKSTQVSPFEGRSATRWWSLTALSGRFCKRCRKRAPSATRSSSSPVTTGKCEINVLAFLCVFHFHASYTCAFVLLGQSWCGGLVVGIQDCWNVAKAQLTKEEWGNQPSLTGLVQSSQVRRETDTKIHNRSTYGKS